MKIRDRIKELRRVKAGELIPLRKIPMCCKISEPPGCYQHRLAALNKVTCIGDDNAYGAIYCPSVDDSRPTARASHVTPCRKAKATAKDEPRANEKVRAGIPRTASEKARAEGRRVQKEVPRTGQGRAEKKQNEAKVVSPQALSRNKNGRNGGLRRKVRMLRGKQSVFSYD